MSNLLYLNQINIDNIDIKALFLKGIIFNSFNNHIKTKFLQKFLINASKEIITFIIEELKGSFRAVIKNKCGNFFFSDLIKICDKNNRIKILKEISKTINEDCMDEFATYPIQNLIQYASSEEEFQLLLLSFNHYESILIPTMDPHGTFVVQKLITNIHENFRIEFNYLFINLISLLAKDKYGTFAIEKFILYTKNEKIQKKILDIILNDFIKISTHKNGNYLIQNMLVKWWDNQKGEYIKQMIKSKYSILSKNFYSLHICNLYDKFIYNEGKRSDSSFLISNQLFVDK